MIKKKTTQEKVMFTRQEEFEVLKLIIDKFLWLGVVGIAVGLFYVYNPGYDPQIGLLFTLTGAIITFILTAVFMRNINVKK